MIIDARQLPQDSHLTADVVIVGTGPAGASVALELAPLGIDILVLEGGALGVDAQARNTLRADESSQEREPLDKMRDKRLGGTSHQWGGRTFAFDAVDFDAAATQGEPWPVSREDMEPYYRRAAQRLDVGAYEYTADPAIPGARKHLLGAPSELIYDEAIWRFGPPVKFGNVLRDKLAARGNVRIMHHANVVRLRRDADGRVNDVEFASSPGVHHHAGGAHVVLAPGGLEAARLLLHSDIGNEHDQVGRNFMTHPIAVVGKVKLTAPASARNTAEYVRSHDNVWVRRLLCLKEDVRREHGLLNMGFGIWYRDARDASHGDPLLSAFALARKALTYSGGFKGTGMHRQYADNSQTAAHVRNVVAGAPQLAGFAGRWARDRWLSRRTLPAFSRISPTGEYALRFDAEQSPDPDNRVTLSPSERDPYGVPRLHVRNEVSREDRLNYLRSIQLMKQGLEDAGFATVELPSKAEVMAQPMIDSTHQMGVVRMGSDPRTSVCDSNLLVWGTTNLYVPTSGAFPTAGQAGPTLTIVAFAIRVADHIAQQFLAKTGDVK